jgi:hypothetical protein
VVDHFGLQCYTCPRAAAFGLDGRPPVIVIGFAKRVVCLRTGHMNLSFRLDLRSS